MTNRELENRLGELVRTEREATREILQLIREAERRRLFVERGFSNAYEWLVAVYGYTRAAAHRRIQAARLLEAVPSAEEKFSSGELNLSVLAQVQSVIQKEEKKTGERISLDEKEDLLSRVEGKSFERVERILTQEFPDVAKGKESLRAQNAEETKLTVMLQEAAVAALKRLRELRSSQSYADVIEWALVEQVKLTDPLTSASNARRARILRRAQGQCEFVDDKTQRRCQARSNLELDHIVPRSLGGSNEDENLRVLCRAHNLLAAERIFGREKMDQFRKAT